MGGGRGLRPAIRPGMAARAVDGAVGAAASTTPFIRLAHRPSTAPLVHCVWTAESTTGGEFSSVAYPQWELVFTHLDGRLTVSLRGPETRATRARCPPSGAWVGIRFRRGVRFTALDGAPGVDGAVTLPTSRDGRFTIGGVTLEVPAADDVEAFVATMARAKLLVHDPVVSDVLMGATPRDDVRTLQRRFVRATGVTPGDPRHRTGSRGHAPAQTRLPRPRRGRRPRVRRSAAPHPRAEASHRPDARAALGQPTPHGSP